MAPEVLKSPWRKSRLESTPPLTWVLKNKHQAVSQNGYSLEARGSRLKTNSDPVSQASSFQPIPCEHLQKPHNAGSRPRARFFNILLILCETA
jgi:hypothetical protein